MSQPYISEGVKSDPIHDLSKHSFLKLIRQSVHKQMSQNKTGSRIFNSFFFYYFVDLLNWPGLLLRWDLTIKQIRKVKNK